MKTLPVTNASPVLRTHFDNQRGWEDICEEIQRPSPEGFEAQVEFIDDPAFDGLNKQQLLDSVPKDYPHSFILVVDKEALLSSEHPVLVVNPHDDDRGSQIGREFRCIPREIWGVENNLSLANMDFGDFADAVDEDGVFRDFR